MKDRFKVVNFEQGTEDWLRWRNGGVGGSEIHGIVKGTLPEWEQVIFHKLYEKSFHFSEVTQKAMDRGHELEPEARERIEKVAGMKFPPCCLELTSDPFFRVSLDGMSEDAETIIEIKCLGSATHNKVVKDRQISDRYFYQIQYQLLVSGARRCLYVGYHPEEPTQLYVQTITPNPEILNEITERVLNFKRVYNQHRQTPAVVAVAGFARTGKDTVGQFLVEKGYQRVAFADKLKEEAVELGILSPNYTEEEKVSKRDLLVGLGKERREQDGDYWLKAALSQMNRDGRYVVTDTRYINEVLGLESFAKQNGMRFLSIWVDRPGVEAANLEELEKTAPIKHLCMRHINNEGTIQSLTNTVEWELLTGDMENA